MAFLATLAYVSMIVVQPTSDIGVLFFRTYYILGILVPAWLGLGSIALVTSARITRISLITLCILSVLAGVLILLATIDLPKLSHVIGTPGTGILKPGVWLVMVIVLNSLGVVAVVGVAIYSGWKLVNRQPNVAGLRTMDLLWANVLILAGDLINGAAGTLARFLGIESVFWVIMALGWIVFFIGVLLASRRPSATKPTASDRGPAKYLASS